MKELLSGGFDTEILVRGGTRVRTDNGNLDVVKAEITKPETLNGLFGGRDIGISTVGTTRQKDGFTYMDIDYRGKANLIDEARRSGVRKFLYPC